MQRNYAHGSSTSLQMPTPRVLAVLLAPLCALPLVHAAEFETGNPDLKVRWDNTVKYSTMFRMKDRSEQLLVDPNQDDPNRNFDRGLVSNRVDLLSELDAAYKGLGIRVSGAAWYDAEYNKRNDNDSSPSTVNVFGLEHNRFSHETRKLNGRNAELLDAFISGRLEAGNMPVTFRLGRHALIWGESLFYGNNGIAAGQAPIDANKALAVPNLRFNELIRPDNQISGQIQVNPNLSFAAYYKLSWEENRLPATGSYLSSVGPDFALPGGDILFVPGTGTAAFFRRVHDVEPGHTGQGGLQVRYRVEGSDLDLGFYAVQYNERNFQANLAPGTFSEPPLAPNQVGEYRLFFHKHVRTYGVSASTTIGNVNFAGEVSVRRNLDLVNLVQIDPGWTSDNDKHPLYAIGNSLHAQFSWLATMSPSFIATEASLVGEIAWNRRTSITKNPDAVDPTTNRDAWSVRAIYEPSYRQVLPGLDISVPVGIGYTNGKSSVVGGFGVNHGGDINVGINGTYLDNWRVSASYTHFYGPEGLSLVPISMANSTFKQSLKDRDFVSLSIRRTF